MKWIRPLSLALAVLAALPGLTHAQYGVWAPLSLPVLFGQENPAPASRDPRDVEVNQEEFGIEVGTGVPVLFPRAASGQIEWTAGEPTPVESCKDLRELVEASWSLFSRRPTSIAGFAVYRTSVPLECAREGSTCPFSCCPYSTITRVLTSIANASAQCQHDCSRTTTVEVCPATAVCQPAQNGSVTFGVHCKPLAYGTCSVERKGTKVAFGPFEIEICLNKSAPCAKGSCSEANATCKNTCSIQACAAVCGSKANACAVPACTPSCNPACTAACSEVRVRVDAGKCACSKESCCPEGKCACVKKAAEKKCGCGKECGCCACKKTVHVHERLERVLRHLEMQARAHADFVVPGCGMPAPGTVMPSLPITIALPPPPPPGFPVPEGMMPAPTPFLPAAFAPVPPPVAPRSPAPVCTEERIRPATTSGSVKLQTPLFDAQCDSLSCGLHADELVLEGNVRVTHKRTSAHITATRVVINTRTGQMRAERNFPAVPPAATTATPPAPVCPVMVPVYEQVPPPVGPYSLPSFSRPVAPMEQAR